MPDLASPSPARIRDNLDRVRQQIATAARAAGRDPAHVTLVAVTKSADNAATQALVDAGATDLAENRIQAADAKIPRITPGPDGPVRWHMIGHLQRNKAKRCLELFDLVHSLDSERLARKLDTLHADGVRTALATAAVASDHTGPLPVLLEVNTSGEQQKGGLAPGAVAPLLQMIRTDLPQLTVHGLMTMAPHGAPEATVRACFTGLRELRDRLERDIAGAGVLPDLSMGMSGDFPIAIAEGATMVRVGSALFA